MRSTVNLCICVECTRNLQRREIYLKHHADTIRGERPMFGEDHQAMTLTALHIIEFLNDSLDSGKCWECAEVGHRLRTNCLLSLNRLVILINYPTRRSILELGHALQGLNEALARLGVKPFGSKSSVLASHVLGRYNG